MRLAAGAVTVRLAWATELDAAGEVVARAYAAEPDMAGHDAYLAEIRDARGRAGDAVILVAVDGAGEILGSATYVPDHTSPWAEVEQPGEAGFRMLGVAPEAQGRGVGRALVMACLALARDAGREAVAISTLATRPAARRLYEDLGFERDPARDFDPVPGVRLLAYVRRL